jgi:iron complex transport system substrate-binding protein
VVARPRRIAPLPLALGLALVSTGCGRSRGSASTAAVGPAPRSSPNAAVALPTAASGTDGDAVAIVDDHGRRWEAAPARRIASLSPALTEVLFAVGCGERVVLRDRWSDHPPEAAAIRAIDALAPSAELLLAARPDVVVASFPAGKLEGALRGAGLPWLGLSPSDLAGVGRDLRRIGALCGRPVAGQRAAEDLAADLRRTAQRVAGRRRPRVYLELDHAAGGRAWTPGDDTFAAAVLRAAGADNAFADLRGWPQIGVEAVLAADPDVVLLAWPGAHQDAPARFAERPGVRGLRAVQQGRVLRVDPAIFGRPGPRVGEAVRTLAAMLHPESR